MLNNKRAIKKGDRGDRFTKLQNQAIVIALSPNIKIGILQKELAKLDTLVD